MLTTYLYQIQFESNAPSQIVEKYKTYSLLFKNTKVVSILSLKNRFEKDKHILKSILGSFGYFGATTFYRIEKRKDGILIFHIGLRLGEQFKVNNIICTGLDKDEEARIRSTLRLREGKLFTEERLNSAVQRMSRFFKNHGYPFVYIDRPVIRLFPKNNVVDVYIHIKKGDSKKFGDIDIQNNLNVKSDFILQKIYLPKGTLYDQRLVEESQKALLKAGVISFAHIKPLDSPQEEAPIRVKVYEAPKRTFLAEGGYSKSDGISGRASWRHRNLFGNAESLEIHAEGSKYLKALHVKSKTPYFFGHHDIVAMIDVGVMDEKSPAYSGKRFIMTAGLEKELTRRWVMGGQILFDVGAMNEIVHLRKMPAQEIHEPEQIRQRYIDKRHFDTRILSFPIYATFNRMNDDLNPTSGFQIHTQLEPSFILSGSRKLNNDAPTDYNKHFISLKCEASHVKKLYRNRTRQSYLILFNKLHCGNIWGTSRDNLVPHKRMYLGGARTMRAYAEKKVGDIDKYGKPLGGISFLMWVIELRYRFKSAFGVNLYNEMGFVSDKHLWHVEQKQWFGGTGASFVYYSKVGPIQFGATVPWRRREFYKYGEKGVKQIKDSLFQIYVGIGQI